MLINNWPLLPLLAKQLDAAMLTHKAIASNLANANTPGYKRLTVRFQEQLRALLQEENVTMRRTHPLHMSRPVTIAELQPQLVTEENTYSRASKNNVDLEQEIVNMAANTLVYETTVRALSDRLSLLGYVVRGR